MVVVLFICFLIILQPDYGGALLILGTVAAIVLCSGISKKSILKISLLGLIGTLVMLTVLLVTGNMDLLFSPGRLARFTGFLHPFENQQGDGYQLVNSYVAIGNGGILGMGLGQGVQKRATCLNHIRILLWPLLQKSWDFGVYFLYWGYCFLLFLKD